MSKIKLELITDLDQVTNDMEFIIPFRVNGSWSDTTLEGKLKPGNEVNVPYASKVVEVCSTMKTYCGKTIEHYAFHDENMRGFDTETLVNNGNLYKVIHT